MPLSGLAAPLRTETGSRCERRRLDSLGGVHRRFGTRRSDGAALAGAAKTTAKGIWFLGKKVAKRKAKKRARDYGDAARAAWLGVTICGPMAAEALGLLEQPKRPSRFPAFLAGTVAGAGAMFLAGRNRTA